MKLLIAVFLATLAVASVACSGAGEAIDQPPAMRIGQDVCVQCGMIISDERFASAYKLADGTPRLFDDIGDMATYHASRGEEVAYFWVHDFDTLDWLQADNAWSVSSDGITTPMGHGLAAYGSLERAEMATAAHGGTVLRWQDVIARYELWR
ncbi:MAG: nitrous oxide reductase accessory protein NosL [Dehalococcoidia bacterium]